MERQLDTFTGEITHITEVRTIERLAKAPFKKSTIGIKKSDGQTAFFENRKKLKEELNVGDIVTIIYYWAGSIKDDRMFNNVIISKITKNK